MGASMGYRRILTLRLPYSLSALLDKKVVWSNRGRGLKFTLVVPLKRFMDCRITGFSSGAPAPAPAKLQNCKNPPHPSRTILLSFPNTLKTRDQPTGWGAGSKTALFFDPHLAYYFGIRKPLKVSKQTWVWGGVKQL